MNFDTVNVRITAGMPSSYPIIVGTGILSQAGNLLKNTVNAKKILIVTNDTVFKLYGRIITNSLEASGFLADILFLQDGEQYKNINSLEKIWEKAIDFKLDRKDAILSLGGGVIGDIAGFAASTYLRGIDFIQVPTTLLAQVDSSVGGKVAINSPQGKNLMGSFYQPKIVISDINTLETLSLEQLKTGLAEVLKYGFIEKSCGVEDLLDISLIDFLKKNKYEIFSLNSEVIKKLVKYCCELKTAVVNQDEKEAGLRAILNFGHTIGHAIEKCTNYSEFTHGQAVSLGMVGVLDIARNKGLIDEEYLLSSLQLIWQYELNYHIPASVEIKKLLDSMLLDKKVLKKKVRFVLPVDSGKVDIFSDIDDSIVSLALEKLY